MKALHYAKQIAYSSWDVLLFTYQTAMKYKDVPGIYCEMGVAAGAQIIAMIEAAPSKEIFAFDSFEGLPMPSNRDDQIPGITMLTELQQKALPKPGCQPLVSSGAVVVSLDSFYDNLDAALGRFVANVHAIKGWFEVTVPEFAEDCEPIAILRLDGDLYNSTWVCLQHLFPKVIQGGCVIIDDWTLQGCQDACKEYFELIGYEPDYKFLDGTAYFYK